MTRRDLRFSIAVLLSSLFVIHAQAAMVFYVATNGNDSWSGHYATAFKSQKDGPLATLEEAVRRSRLERKTPAHVEIFLRSGIHVVAEPIILTANDSDLTIAAYKDESATVSGQSVISNWTRVTGSTNLWQAKVSDEKLKKWNFRELFVNNHRKQRARTPNDGFFRLVGN